MIRFQNIILAVLTLIASGQVQAADLRVCADPNNLPFSNKKEEGFENKIADVVARDLGLKVKYTWWAQRRGYIRNTLKAQDCDVWIGMAAGVEMAATTTPYYRSSYVFVARSDRHLDIASLDDPRLKALTIGVQMIGNDAINTPPAHALAKRGIVDNVRGFMLYGDYNKPDPAADIVRAVDSGALDIAIVWGPLAGYFAAKSSHPMTLVPVFADDPNTPMQFDIAAGVRKTDADLKFRIERALQTRQTQIAKILRNYHVVTMPDDRKAN